MHSLDTPSIPHSRQVRGLVTWLIVVVGFLFLFIDHNWIQATGIVLLLLALILPSLRRPHWPTRGVPELDKAEREPSPASAEVSQSDRKPSPIPSDGSYSRITRMLQRELPEKDVKAYLDFVIDLTVDIPEEILPGGAPVTQYRQIVKYMVTKYLGQYPQLRSRTRYVVTADTTRLVMEEYLEQGIRQEEARQAGQRPVTPQSRTS